ncbi:MAG TPA: ferredoxin--NADP(+) reductase [Bacteroidetes bacterium]|nr:ferredoxin--NADP(+) reductase [Bacteroidota bacterium]HRK04343.1 NAD(P)/FAD-dependent oxidoreductase [Chlorobiota bacterium]
MSATHSTDVIIIGAGPCGLFSVFEAGLLKMKCHLVDYLPIPGGQCAEIYPKKPIYDIPGYPSVLAGDLITNLMKQIEPFHPEFTLGERAETIERLDGGRFRVTTHRGTSIEGSTILIAGGLGCFEPRKPMIGNITDFEDRGVEYIIRDPEFYRGKRVIIGGGGDSALDWTIVLADIASEVTLVHRSQSFRAAPDSVSKAQALADAGKIRMHTDAQVAGLIGDGQLQSVVVERNDKSTFEMDVDHFIPLFGLSPKLGPIADWGLSLDKNAINVDPTTYRTNVEGIYAVGDISEYPNKLKLILCGFHEAAVALNVEYQRLHPEKKHVLKYTTVTGIAGL